MKRRWPALLLVALLHEAFILSAQTDTDVRLLTGRVSPQAMEETFQKDPARVRPTLDLLAQGILARDPALREHVRDYWVSLARTSFERLGSRGGPWSQTDLDLLLVIQLLDPERFVRDPSFRSLVLEVLPRHVPEGRHPELRDRHLYELNQLIDFDFEASEFVESSWGAVPRASRTREIPLAAEEIVMEDAPDRKIQTSIFSLPSAFFDPEVVADFLRHLRSSNPDRELVVLTDQPVLSKLNRHAGELRIVLLNSHGRSYSPWPRDPFTTARAADGGLVLLVRPNLQKGREEDTFLARELVQTLPPDVDRRLGGVKWARSPVPFHNGKILMMPDGIWIDIHTLEVRILELLGIDAVPVRSFSSREGLDRYLSGAARAARELESLYGKRVRFVHPVPQTGSLETRTRMMQTLGGGAEFDLDSLVTLLPGKDRMTAFVADVHEGREMMQQLPDEEWKTFQSVYELDPDLARLRTAIDAAQAEGRAVAVQEYLNVVASQLQTDGARVVRVPLVFVPTALMTDREGLSHPDFLLTWNNVVLETLGGRRRAEGFASRIASADRIVSERFRDVGWELQLLPPLTRSIILKGGYRCASTHVRALPASERVSEPTRSERVP